MSDDEINVAIAEACGWFDVKMRPVPLEGCGEVLSGKFGAKDYVYAIPNYCNDLNAMHEAEKMLSTGGRTQYIFHLQTLCGGQQFGDNYFATARQRAEAFLKTIGKWSDKQSANQSLRG